MKFFACANGQWINPALVTMCGQGKIENKYYVRFWFGDWYWDELFDRQNYAETELGEFIIFCEEI